LRLASTAAVLLTALAGTAIAGGFSGNFDAVEASLGHEAQDLVADTTKTATRLRKKIEKALAKYGKPSTATSYVKELAKAKGLVALADKFLSDDAALLAEVDVAIASVTADMRGARDALEEGSQDAGLPGRKQKQLRGKLKRADKTFPLLAAASRAKQMSLLKRLASLTKGFEGPSRDPGTGAEHTWVMNSMVLADEQDSFDLDGDGRPDNALGSLNGLLRVLDPNSDLDLLLAEAFTSEGVLLLQMWGVSSFDDDDNVAFGVLSGLDTDGMPADNFSGTESFSVPAGLDGDGHAVVHGNTPIGPAGAYALEVAIDTLDFGIVALANLPETRIRATASAAANDGVLGFVIPATTLTQLVEIVSGQPLDSLQTTLLNNLLDIDLDGDGDNDSLSAALAFTSVPASIDPPPQ
jgi:hypothetical protein